MIVLMAGLPGTGKSTLARELAARTFGRVLGKDEIRHALFAADEIEYSSRQDDFCLQIMLEAAGYLLQRDPSRKVFLDGRILECVCSQEIARQRLEEQVALGTHAAGNRDFRLYLEVKSRFEYIALPKTVIDTGEAVERCVEKALAGLH